MGSRLLFIILLIIIGVASVQIGAGVRELRARAQYPAEGKFVDVDGVKIHYERFGAGPDVILVHGASGNTRDFTFGFVDLLKDDYRVTVFDRPGMGHSKQPDGYGGMFNRAGEPPILMAQLLKGAADKIGVKNPIVVGHSLGGALAMAWALEFPDDTAGIVMLAGVSHPWPGDLNWQYPVNAHPAGGAIVVPVLSAFVPKAYVDGVVASIFEPQTAPAGYIDHVGTNLSLRRSALRANARQVNGLRPHIVDMSKTYPQINLPIEAIHGDADTIVPMEIHSIPLSERVANANLTILEGVGHMPHHTNPQDAVDAINRVATRAGLR